ncbi:ATP-dependent helicase [Alicyclobacillus tolerans]|uniref:ATP-dependent helicase n=1 Tax=Alicyclobacillus tolerans TaxID=90970 RepID=UPI003B7BFEEC
MPKLQELNPAQQEAAQHKDGPCLVVAAAGSGKTAMLMARIQYLIESCHVQPKKILACTFTRKAAEEMRIRLAKLIGVEAAEEVTISTLHAVAYQMVRGVYAADWKLQADTSWLVERVLEPAGPYNTHGIGPVMKLSEAIAEIARAKADLRVPQADSLLGKVYYAYEALRQEKKCYGMEDMLQDAVRLLRSREEMRQLWQNRWDYVMVDEFQDTNWAQWQLLLGLSERTHNLFAVGDDWQAIYGFRGARPELMQTFLNTFPETKVVHLIMNYRSHELIVELGQRVIALNRGYQLEKQVIAARDMEDAVVQAVQVKNEVEEASFIVTEIRRRHQKHPELPWQQMAILYRSNLQSQIFEEALEEADIPYQVVGDKHFYESYVVKGLLDYLRALNPYAEPQVWGKLINRPNRKIPRSVVTEVTERGWVSMMEHPKCKPFSDVLRALGKVAEQGGPGGALQWLVQNVPELIPESMQGESWLDTFILSARRFGQLHEYLRYVDRMVEKGRKQKGNAVCLSTLHKSKGLEYHTVFLAGMVEGVFPHRRSTTPEELREETRLCYVGITRAKENLFLLSAKHYGGDAKVTSRFIRALSDPKQ